jgi:DnaK suppressor protein
VDTATLNACKQRLEQMREALRAGSGAALEATKPVQLDQSSVGRLSRMDAMQGQAMAIETQRRRQILERRIERALRMIASNDFGVCEGCDEAIDPRRLEADPTSTLCIRCAGAREDRA